MKKRARPNTGGGRPLQGSAKGQHTHNSSQLAVTVYTHNMLADTWVNLAGDGGKAFYRGIDLKLLDPSTRQKAAIARALDSKADILCFQEVGSSALALQCTFTALQQTAVGCRCND